MTRLRTAVEPIFQVGKCWPSFSIKITEPFPVVFDANPSVIASGHNGFKKLVKPGIPWLLRLASEWRHGHVDVS